MLEKAFSDMSSKIVKLEDSLLKNLDMIIHNYLSELLKKNSVDKSNIEDKLSSLGVTFPEKYFTVVALVIPQTSIESKKLTDMQLCKYMIIDYIKKAGSVSVDSAKTKYYPIDADSLTISVIVNTGTNDLKYIESFVNEVQFYCYNSLHFYLSAGIGRYVDNIELLHQSSIDAKIAINYKFLYPEKNSFYFEEISKAIVNDDTVKQDHIDKLQKALRICSIKEVNSTLDGIFSIITQNNINYQFAKKVISKIRKIYLECIEELGVNIDELFTADGRCNISIKTGFLSPGSIYQFFEACRAIPEMVVSCLAEKKTSRSTKLIELVNEYIQNNISSDLSLNQVSDIFHVSPQYLSRIFKDEKGVNYIDFITQCKIEKARNLLSSTNMTIDEIANHLGYTYANYFSRKFKQYTGCTPGEYRLKEVKSYINKGNK